MLWFWTLSLLFSFADMIDSVTCAYTGPHRKKVTSDLIGLSIVLFAVQLYARIRKIDYLSLLQGSKSLSESSDGLSEVSEGLLRGVHCKGLLIGFENWPVSYEGLPDENEGLPKRDR